MQKNGSYNGVVLSIPMNNVFNLEIKEKRGQVYRALASRPQENCMNSGSLAAFRQDHETQLLSLVEFIMSGLKSHRQHLTVAMSNYFAHPDEDNYWLVKDVSNMGARMIRMAQAEFGRRHALLADEIDHLQSAIKRSEAMPSISEESV